MRSWVVTRCFFFNDTATTEIYTLSLRDALPIFDEPRGAGALRGHPPHRSAHGRARRGGRRDPGGRRPVPGLHARPAAPRSEEHTSELSHANISYAVFCLKKNKLTKYNQLIDSYQ